MFGLGPQELLVIFLIALVIFGPKRLPEIAKALGKAINNLNKASKSVIEEFKEASSDNTNENITKKNHGLKSYQYKIFKK